MSVSRRAGPRGGDAVPHRRLARLGQRPHLGAHVADETVIAESPCQPSTIAPKSIEIRSPSASFSVADGMPCTTRSLTDAQITAG